ADTDRYEKSRRLHPSFALLPLNPERVGRSFRPDAPAPFRFRPTPDAHRPVTHLAHHPRLAAIGRFVQFITPRISGCAAVHHQRPVLTRAEPELLNRSHPRFAEQRSLSPRLSSVVGDQQEGIAR